MYTYMNIIKYLKKKITETKHEYMNIEHTHIIHIFMYFLYVREDFIYADGEIMKIFGKLEVPFH